MMNIKPEFCKDPDTYDDGTSENQSLVASSAITKGSKGPSSTRFVPRKEMTSRTEDTLKAMEFEDGEEESRTGKRVCGEARKELVSEYFEVHPAEGEQAESAQGTGPASTIANSTDNREVKQTSTVQAPINRDFTPSTNSAKRSFQLAFGELGRPTRRH
jgi:hypothetical protein